MDYYYVRVWNMDDSQHTLVRVNESEYKLLNYLDECEIIKVEDLEMYFSDEN